MGGRGKAQTTPPLQPGGLHPLSYLVAKTQRERALVMEGSAPTVRAGFYPDPGVLTLPWAEGQGGYASRLSLTVGLDYLLTHRLKGIAMGLEDINSPGFTVYPHPLPP